MGKAKLLDVNAINVGMRNVKDGIGFGAKLAEQNANFASRLTNRQKQLNKLAHDHAVYGLSAERKQIGQELFDKELNGRSLASIVNSHKARFASAIDRCISPKEVENVTVKFENEAKLKLESLKFLQKLFAPVEEKEAVKAKA